MIIGIDARMYGPLHGGIGRYIEKLIVELEKLDTQNEYRIFLNADNWPDYQPQNPKFRKVLANIPWYGWREQVLMPGLVKRNRVDLMHWPHWNVPIFYNGKSIVTIHDLILWHFPSRQTSTLDPWFYWIKYFFFRLLLRWVIKRADKILVPSEFTRNDVLKIFSLPLEKVIVIYEGAGQRMGAFGAPKKNFLSQLTIYQPYVLYVGSAYPHKNLDNLLEGFEKFNQRHPWEYQLVLAGRDSYFYQRLKNLLHSRYYQLPIVLTGFVPDNHLPWLYERASGCVFPSFYEGFGLPGLEAMQAGVPVAAANSSCLLEIYGPAAVYFDPCQPEEIASSLEQILTQPRLRSELKQKGLERAQKFSWARCAQDTLQAYQSVV